MQTRFVILFLISAVISTVISCNNKAPANFQEPNKKQKGFLTLNSRACYFADADSIEKQTQIKIDTPSCREIEQIQSIMDYAGLPQNFKIYRGNIDNALATVVNNQRLIIYNKDLFAAMDAMNSSYWTSLFIIAHEIGHHLANNISDTSNALIAELDADRFAGFILFRMGADSNQAIAAVSSGLISTTHDSKTHPSKTKRIEAVKKSWKESFDLRDLSAVPPIIADRFTATIGTEFEKYKAGFSYEYLIYNELFLSKWNLKRVDYMDQEVERDTSFDRYLQYLDESTMELKGIITDVQAIPDDAAFKNVKQLSVEVMIKQIDTKVYPNIYPDIVLNRKQTFTVAYQPYFSYDKVKDFYDFFVGGRYMSFDIFKWKDGKNTYYISNANAIKEMSF